MANPWKREVRGHEVIWVFVFELRVVDNEKTDIVPPLKFDEFQFALFLRILKSRNRELYDLFNGYYDKVSERTEG